MRFLVVALVALWFQHAAARDRQGMCSPCTFMNETAVVGCSPLIKFDGWRVSGRSYLRFMHEMVCLGQPVRPDSAPDQPATNVLRVQTNAKYMNDYSLYTQMDAIYIVNVFAQRSLMEVDYKPEESIFARVLYKSDKDNANIAGGTPPWMLPAWPDSDETTVTFVGASEANSTADPLHYLFPDPIYLKTRRCEPGADGRIPRDCDDGFMFIDEWSSYGCNGAFSYCLPYGWNAAMISGATPVFTYSVWCSGGVSTGISNGFEGCPATNNCNFNATRCQTTQQKDADPVYCGRHNECTNSGLCRCTTGYGGAACERRLSAAMATTPLPAEWTGDPYNVERDNADWQFWTCAVYNPCSGAGKCVDSFKYDQTRRRFRPVPRCECYPGFFGNSSSQLDAYAHVFFCDKEQGDVPAVTWKDSDADGHAISRYMMLHQCMLWNGPESPPNYELSWTNRFGVGNQPIPGFRPAMPPKCKTGFVGGRCLPCPPCVDKQGTCRAIGDDESVAVCECHPDYTGHLCQLPICPMFQGSPCGARALPVPRGACVLSVANATVVPYANLQTSPYRCDCDNGYGGNACQFRQCAVPPRSKPEVVALMCSGSSLTRYGPKVSEPHGECKATGNGTTGVCVCLPQYTGANCERWQCPTVTTANGTVLVCNGLMRFGTKDSVCQNSNPDDYPVCLCNSARPNAAQMARMVPEERRRAMYTLSFFGDACQHSFNLSCLDPRAPEDWCNSREDGVGRCEIDLSDNGGSLYPPHCVCGETSTQTGRWCEQSKCGIRYMDTEPVPQQLVCRGYDNVKTVSGSCQLLETSKISDRLGIVSDPQFSDGVVRPTMQIQAFGLCRCQANATIQVERIGNPPADKSLQTGFIGAFCQTAVPGCTSDSKICSNVIGEPHGACVLVPETEALRPVPGLETETRRFRHRCSCVAGFNGTFCENRIAVCHPPCRPGAGVCELVPGGVAVCKCRNAKFIYTDESQPEQCGVNLCSLTGGTTSLETAECLCPAGKWPTAIKFQVAGCRPMCPVDPVTGFECGLPGEAGAQRCSNYPTDQAGVDSATMANTILNDKDLHCMCGEAKFVPPNTIMHLEQAALIDDGRERIMWAPDGVLCMPVCGHGSHDAVQGSECTCPPGQNRDDFLDPPCKQYARPYYQMHECNDRGLFNNVARTCSCRDPTWYTAASKCSQTVCAPEGNVQNPAVALVCNCTYPYRADTDRFSPTFRRCVGVCLNGGVPSAATRKCVCSGVYTGKYCEIDSCAPFGTACGGGRSCCCSTPVVTGSRCDQSNCGAHGQLVRVPLPPSCACDAFWTGTVCQTDTCGIVGDGDKITGAFKNGQCECIPGYAKDRSGRCTVPLCGVQGTVIQTPEARLPHYGFSCVCHAPSELDAFGVCTQGSCGQGALIEGVGGEKVQCQCNPGWEGPKCNKPKCGTSDRVAFVNGNCVCLYPYGGELAQQCPQTFCGEGGVGVAVVSPPGNPRQYECICNAKAGYALEPDLAERRKPGAVPCVQKCNVNGTARIDQDRGCICKIGFVGMWCDSPQRYEPADCPNVPAALSTPSGDFSKATYFGSVFGVAGGFAIVVIALAVVLAKSQSGGEKGSVVERKRLVN